MEIPDRVRDFVIAVRTRARQDERFDPPSHSREHNSAGYLASLIAAKLSNKDRKVRMKVLQAITGLPVQSTLALTQYHVSVLIDEVLNDDKKSTLSEPSTISIVERLLEERLLSGGIAPAWELFPWERPTVDLPDLWFEHPE
jgi:hypothetical protein